MMRVFFNVVVYLTVFNLADFEFKTSFFLKKRNKKGDPFLEDRP